MCYLMSTIKRFGILLLLINPLLAFLMLYSYFTWYFFSEYPMAKVIAPTYDSSILLILFIACCLNVPLLIWAYITKNNKFNKIIILFSTLIIGLSILFVVNILGNYNQQWLKLICSNLRTCKKIKKQQ